MRMKTNDGLWTYILSVFSSAMGLAGLITFKHVIFAIGFLAPLIISWLTYRSNDRKNKALIEESLLRGEEERKRTEIIRQSVACGTPPSASQAVMMLGKAESKTDPEEVNDGDADISA